MTGISSEVNNGILTRDALMRQEPEITHGAMHMYMTAKAGPLCTGGIGSYAYLPFMDTLSRAGQATGLKDVLSELASEQIAQDHIDFLRSILESQTKAAGSLFMFPAQVNLHSGPDAKDFLQNLVSGNFLSLGAALLHPLSRGSVHINSLDPARHQLLTPDTSPTLSTSTSWPTMSSC